MKTFIISSILLIASFPSFGQSDVDLINDEVSQRSVRAHLEFLASDALQGRNTGSQGLEAAAAYVGSHFRAAGIEEIDDSYYQGVVH